MELQQDQDKVCWFVMRDLSRPNAKVPAYKRLSEMSIEVFTPMKWHLSVREGRRVREKRPFMQDLLFVHSSRSVLDPIVFQTPTLQYRFARGGGYMNPMTVPYTDMQRFIVAVNSTDRPYYFLPTEITPDMYGRKVRILGGPFDCYEGYLLSSRGSRVKRLIVNLPGLLSVAVEINPDYIELL